MQFFLHLPSFFSSSAFLGAAIEEGELAMTVYETKKSPFSLLCRSEYNGIDLICISVSA